MPTQYSPYVHDLYKRDNSTLIKPANNATLNVYALDLNIFISKSIYSVHTNKQQTNYFYIMEKYENERQVL
jgi:hypothetical protein